MSVTIYWQERLQKQSPLRNVEGYKDYLRNNGDSSWPQEVGREALYQDYLEWHEEVFLQPYRASKMYKDMPSRLPVPAEPIGFYNQMAPLLYVIDKHRQVRNRKLRVKQCIEGQWVDGLTGKYFVRLAAWGVHCAAFELETGLKVHANVEFFDPAQSKLINDARTEWDERSEANRKAMEEQMGRTTT